jgi:hypothetical protein
VARSSATDPCFLVLCDCDTCCFRDRSVEALTSQDGPAHGAGVARCGRRRARGGSIGGTDSVRFVSGGSHPVGDSLGNGLVVYQLLAWIRGAADVLSLSEGPCGQETIRPAPTKRSFGDVRSQAELGTELTESPDLRVQSRPWRPVSVPVVPSQSRLSCLSPGCPVSVPAPRPSPSVPSQSPRPVPVPASRPSPSVPSQSQRPVPVPVPSPVPVSRPLSRRPAPVPCPVPRGRWVNYLLKQVSWSSPRIVGAQRRE